MYVDVCMYVIHMYSVDTIGRAAHLHLDNIDCTYLYLKTMGTIVVQVLKSNSWINVAV